jgi:hypothetical protein
LAFERMFVSALVRRHVSDPDEWHKAVRRLPGRTLAYRALESSNEPLTLSNFLKGQAVNGPFGVMGRLVRHLDIVDDDDQLGRAGEELLLAFAKDEELPGLLDDGRNGSEGVRWLDSMARFTNNHLSNGKWWNSGWDGWNDIAERLRPDRIGRQEVKVLRRLVADDPLRGRCLAVLRDRETTKTFLDARKTGWRGYQDRQTLREGILPHLQRHTNPDDRTLALAIELADAYERTACLMQTGFDGLRWSLTRHGGQASREQLAGDPQLSDNFGHVVQELGIVSAALRTAIKKAGDEPRIVDHCGVDPLNEMADDAESASQGILPMLGALMARHERVQKAKRKGMWIDMGDRWVLLPGFGLADSDPPVYEDTFVHPFRIPNAYALLGELGQVRLEVPDGEA